jgi:hypothetical protein
MAEKVIRAAIRIVSWRTIHSTFGLCGLFQQLAKFDFVKISRFVMRINAAIRLFTYGCPTQLQRCRSGAGQLKQLAGAALISFARAAPPTGVQPPDLVFSLNRRLSWAHAKVL